MAHLAHLARRFFWSLRGGTPDLADEAWLLGLLSSAERRLYEAQPMVDRRHSVRAACHVRDQARGSGDDIACVASALHDVGKARAGLGTFSRVGATIAGRLWWRTSRGDHRWGRYLRHDEIGATLLAEAGSDPLVVAWARDHHHPSKSTIDPPLVALLLAADDL